MIMIIFETIIGIVGIVCFIVAIWGDCEVRDTKNFMSKNEK